MKDIVSHIKKNYSPYFFFILLCVLNNCSNESTFESQNPLSDKYIQFSLQNNTEKLEVSTSELVEQVTKDGKYLIEVTIQKTKWGEPEYVTRTNWGTSGAVQWNPGDAVGIYMRKSTGIADPNIDRNNIQYITTGNTNTSILTTTVIPPLSFPVSPTNYVNFYAYYPYSTVSQAGLVQFPDQPSMNLLNFNYIIPANQSNASTISNSDLMYASSTNKNNSSLNVPLSFNHALTLLTFKITSNDFNGITLTQLSLSGNKVTNTGNFNLYNSKLTTNTTTFSPYCILNQTLSNTNPISTDMIINPCTVAGTNTDMNLTLAIGNMNYKCAVPANTFLAGYRYTININIKNTQGNNVIISVGNGGQAQVGQTIIPAGGKGSFNNKISPLAVNFSAQPGWVPYAIITDNGAPIFLSTNQQSYTIPQNSIKSTANILFQPSAWYPVNGLIIHYDGIYSGGYGISNPNSTGNTTWIDLSGNNKNATLGNFNFNTSSGWVNNSLKFDGTNDAVSYPGDMTNTFTMNFVLNIASGSQNTNARITAESDYPCFVVTSSGTIAVKTGGILGLLPTITNFGVGYTPVKNQKIQLTMTCSNRNVRLYVNGVYFGTATISSTSFPSSASSALLGAAGGLLSILLDSPLKADYHSFMLYNRVLSDSEIQSMYNFNRSRFLMP